VVSGVDTSPWTNRLMKPRRRRIQHQQARPPEEPSRGRPSVPSTSRTRQVKHASDPVSGQGPIVRRIAMSRELVLHSIRHHMMFSVAIRHDHHEGADHSALHPQGIEVLSRWLQSTCRAHCRRFAIATMAYACFLGIFNLTVPACCNAPWTGTGSAPVPHSA